MTGLGIPSGPLVWTEMQPQGDSFAVSEGERYAGLASVTRDQSLASVVSYLNGHGWEVTYSWEYGTPTRNLYNVDAWLSGLSADTTGNHRWVWIEANRTGDDATIGVSAPWPFSFYSVAHAFEATPAPPSAAPAGPALPSSASVTAPAAPGPSAFAVGAIALGGAGVLYLAWRLLR